MDLFISTSIYSTRNDSLILSNTPIWEKDAMLLNQMKELQAQNPKAITSWDLISIQTWYKLILMKKIMKKQRFQDKGFVFLYYVVFIRTKKKVTKKNIEEKRT
jgi:hypothetical protein